MILYSVIIPAYNAGRTIEKCLASAGNQSVPKEAYEIIVIDDGSTDNTAETAKKFPVRYFYQPNSGPATARNNGAREAKGEIILFTDADCMPHANWIEEMVRPLKDSKIMAVKGVYKSRQKALTARFAQIEFEERYEMLKKAESIDMVDTYSAAYKKDIFHKLGGFDPSFPIANNEDTEFAYKMSQAGYKMVFNPNAIVHHLNHPDSIKRYARLKFWRGYWRMVVYKKYPDKMLKDTYTPQTLKLQILFLFLFLTCLPFSWLMPNLMFYPTILCLILFILSTLPFIRLALTRDLIVALLSPFFLSVRAVSLGTGTLWVILSQKKSKMITSPGNEQIFKSVCRICHGGCGAILYVKDGRLVKVKGDPDSPLNKGWMCIKGLASPEIANHPDRLKHPLKRKGKRGGGEWEKVSWDEVLDEIASKIDAIRKESGTESIALGQGTGRHHYMHVVRFANQLGTPNWYEPGLAQCFIPRITVSNLTYGNFIVGDYYGDTPPKCILFWGHNPLISGPDGELSILVRRALDKGAAGIAIDPRRSETAKKCGLWLPVRPGTDAALALAMINVLIKEKIYDKEFVEKWTFGFDKLKDHVTVFTPEWAEKITWVPTVDIVKAARMYASNKPAILEWGLGIEQNANSLQTVRAIAILRALTGNIDIPGGDIFGMNIIKGYPALKDKLPDGMSKKRLGAESYKLLGGWRAFMPSAHIPALFKAMRTGEPYSIRALLIFGNNALVTIANSMEVYESLKKLDLMVVTDLFMTPTAAMADYVLPAAFWPEVEQVIAYPLVAENIVIAQQKATETAQCRQDEWIMDELAKRLKLPGSGQGFKDIIDYQLSTLGITFQKLKEQGFIHPPHVYKKYENAGFRTPSKKVELYCRPLEKMGYAPLPVYKEPSESPFQSPELAKEFSYVLTTGSRRLEFFHSEHRQIKSLRRRRPHPQVEIHPDTAIKHGIKEGDWVRVSSPRGSIRLKALVTEDIRPSVINVEHGWWFPEKPGPDYGVWESNANLLTNNAPPYDPAFGSYQLRGLLCQIQKEEE